MECNISDVKGEKKRNIQQIQIKEHYKIIELQLLEYQSHKNLRKIE